MAYLALYRKYRPKSFEEFVGQDKVVTVIKNAVKYNKVSHAYLFSGPRGTGKTTTAKIIAKMVNCNNLIDGVPCEKCNNCLKINNSSDVIEIDAASNNGVDEIRNIRDKVNLVPTELKYKIYIIDEVHMLTTQAFNALLKTLEEPPQHVIFILATTEFYKIPLTIISRCQKFDFSKIDDDLMVKNLKRIALAENISVSDDVLYEISRLADGCCRDAVNLFDQLISYSNGNIDLEHLFEISGSLSYRDLSCLINYIINGNSIEILKFCNNISDNGKSINKFVEEFLVFIKDIISYKVGLDNLKIKEKRKLIIDISSKVTLDFLYNLTFDLNNLLNNLKLSSYPSILLSVSLLKFVDNLHVNDSFKIDNVKNDDNDKYTNNSVNNENLDYNFNSNIFKLESDDIKLRINNTFYSASKTILNDVKSKWSDIDSYLIKYNFENLTSILKECNPVAAGDGYVIFVGKYDSVVDRFNSSIPDIEMFLFKIFNKYLYVVSLTEDDWSVEKNNYIKNLKSGLDYKLLPINNNYNNLKFSFEKKDVQSDLDVLKDLVGNDIIEYV